MIDERFSKRAFDEAGMNSPAARQLADDLAEAVTARLHTLLKAEFQRLVGELNALGHSLRPYHEGVGELAYRDDNGEGTTYECRLRLAADCVISTGYAHLLADE